MSYPFSTRGPGRIILLLAGLALGGVAGPVKNVSAADSMAGGLADLPVPSYHAYNMCLLHPVGKLETSVQADGARLTLDECIDIALKQNHDHNIVREQLRATWGDLFAAWGAYVPVVFATSGMSQSNSAFPVRQPDGNSYYRGRTSKSSYANLQISFFLFDSGKKYFGLRNAYYLRSQVRSQVRGSELETVNQVRGAYFNVLRQEKLLLAAQEQAGQLREVLRRAEVRLSIGEVTRLDVLQARIDLQNQELEILEYENLLAVAKLDLDLEVGGGLGTGFELADQFEVRRAKLDIDGLIAEALEKHPDLESLRLQVKQQEGNLWMGRLAYLPTIKTTLGYSRSQSELTFVPDYMRGRQVSYSISWNILDSFQRLQQNSYTKMNLNSLKYQALKVRLTIIRDIRESHLDLLKLHSRHLTLEQNKQMSAQSLHLETRRYELGSSSIVELRQAQADYSQAEVDYINSIYDYQAALSELSRNVGRDITLDLQ
ncbi:MAG: TolC family protein [Gemmatimonadota bacterium]|nr:TolC family protein [Gemmatimonadota bacterium]